MDTFIPEQETLKMAEPKPANDSKPKKARKPKPVLMPQSETTAVDIKIRVEQSSTDWDKLQSGDVFTLDKAATQFFAKKSVSSALNLSTRKPIPVGGAAVYRVYL